MNVHHIIPKHEWKRRFGNLDGSNAPDNLVNLSLEQHIQVHQLLFELNGYEYDRLAVLRMSGQIGHEEATKRAGLLANIGNKRLVGKRNALGFHHSEDFKRRKSDSMKGNDYASGAWSLERRVSHSIRMTGKKRGPYRKKKLGEF